MEERNQKNEEQNREFSFINEKIKEKPVNKRKLAHKIAWVAFCGILFGLVSCVTFVAAKPKLEKLMEPKPDNTVTFPPDQKEEENSGVVGTDGNVSSSTAANFVSGSLQGAEGTTGEPGDPNQTEVTGEPGASGSPDGSGSAGEGQGGTKQPGDIQPEEGQENPKEPETVYIEKELEIEDYQILQNKLYAIGKKGNRSVVTVTGVTSNMDWFDSAYESENQASGLIIANNGQELLILTEKKVITNAEAIEITFINDEVAPAILKKYDGNTGIAIISVALSDISEETMGKIDVATLGNSLTINQGTVVIAIGSPLGVTYSILCGTITSSGNTVSVWDSSYTIFTTDIMGSSKGSGVLVNLNGEVVGLVMQGYSSEGDQNTLTALSISQLKGIIEDLSNGRAIPYLGVKVSTVTDEIARDFGLPKGVYVKSVETDIPSPAMDVGLQEADVIIAMDGEEVLTVEEYTKRLQALEPEQQLKLTVMRQNGEEYVQLEFNATVGVLQ